MPYNSRNFLKDYFAMKLCVCTYSHQTMERKPGEVASRSSSWDPEHVRGETVCTTVVCSFFFGGSCLCQSFHRFSPEKMKNTFREKRSSYRHPYPFVSPVFSSFVRRRNRSTWYLKSCLQFCDNVYIAYLS